MTSELYRWKSLRGNPDALWEAELVAYWEVQGDPISDDYTPDEITALELLSLWARKYGEKHKDGLIPIYWSIEGTGGIYESMPFAYDHLQNRHQPQEHFLTFYTWPKFTATDQPLNWFEIPVTDKRWNKERADKGGFIQEATGWKPGILQPYVYLPALLNATGP